MISQFQKEWMDAVSAPRKALLIDDNIDDCKIITDKSKSFNINWEVTHNGKEALEKIKDSLDCGTLYPLIVLDLDLQSEPQGVELFRQIKKICPTCPVLVLSGYLTNEKITAIANEGFAMFAQKPSAFDSNFFTEFFLTLNIPKVNDGEKIQNMTGNI